MKADHNKLVYFKDRSTAIVLDHVDVGTPVFKGTMEQCLKVQDEISSEDRRSLFMCYYTQEEIDEIITGMNL